MSRRAAPLQGDRASMGVAMDRAVRGSTILFSEMTPQSSWEGEFNDWYDREHIPLRMACPGFLSAQRYLAPASRNYLAIYEMGAPGDLRTPAYAKVKGEPSDLTRRMLAGVGGFTRYIASEPAAGSAVDAAGMDARGLLATFLRVGPGDRDAFERWASDARPAGGRLRLTRRLAISDGDPGDWTDLMLFYLEDGSTEAGGLAAPVAPPGVASRSLFFVRHGARQVAGG